MTDTNALTNVLVAESHGAWSAGAQNCPGPISEEAASRKIIVVLMDHGLLPRPCNCGSGMPWDQCGDDPSGFCG